MATDRRQVVTGNEVIKAVAEAFGLDHRKVRRLVLDADVQGAAVLYVEEYASTVDASAGLSGLASKLALVHGDPAARVRVVVV